MVGKRVKKKTQKKRNSKVKKEERIKIKREIGQPPNRKSSKMETHGLAVTGKAAEKLHPAQGPVDFC